MLLGFVWPDDADYVDGAGLQFLEPPAWLSFWRAFDLTFVGNKFLGKELARVNVAVFIGDVVISEPPSTSSSGDRSVISCHFRSGASELCNFSSELCNFLSLLCLFLVIILATEKGSMDGSHVSDCKKNDGLGRIRTGDLRRVKATS